MSERMHASVLDSKTGVKRTKFIEVAIHVVKQNKMKVHFVIYLQSQDIFSKMSIFYCIINCI